MSTSTPTPEQVDEFAKSVRAGLAALYKPPPVTGVEWADENFYLSSESSYHEGRWQTLPFQRAILNAMTNDQIEVVNVAKSARLGYTKMLLAALGYFAEHKKRNCLTFSPTDDDRDRFMKTHVETMIRDVGAVRALAPWYGKKHRDNTISAKVFANGKQLICHGGKAARNYREISADVVIYDELAGFDRDIEKEGTPTSLGDKRLEGATYRKSIRGSTLKIAGQCMMEQAAAEAPVRLRFHVPCPHCGEEQVLKWGDKESGYGIKWDQGKPDTAHYQCEHNACVIRQHELHDESREFHIGQGRYVCDETGTWTRDGIEWFNVDDEPIATPRAVSFYIWTAYSPLTTWTQIVYDFLNAKGDPIKLKTFVNTTLGETWDDTAGQKLDWEILHSRREVFPEVPDRAVGLFGGIDTQDDRYEGRVYAYGAQEESWLIDRWIIYGDPAGAELLRKVGERMHKIYSRADGSRMTVVRWCWDSGGHYTDEVYKASKRHGIQWVIPTRGANVYGKPIQNFPRKRNSKGVFLTEIGTDNAKELIFNRLQIQPNAGEPVPGCIHLPANDAICDSDEVKQITAEIKVRKIVQGRAVYRWDSGGRRNEGLDCAVLALAALRISQERFGFDLDGPVAVAPDDDDTPPTPPAAPPPGGDGGGWLQTPGGAWV
ncbi:phage terminase large subunit family protein [Salinicola corii]|uniref:Phage terminase large subunit family protein n=1 Tax=Salinicola corii TaxID=2606937 RepID=A0A640WAB4_9GAMM|nr:terminase gpA endonuclease subunit [Salinicola corii]KAA0015493.1 phage terminase large subunit family protein [Salinicola corii]